VKMLGSMLVYCAFFVVIMDRVVFEGLKGPVSGFLMTWVDQVDESAYQKCQYEGHCMVGFTCVKSIEQEGGICRPYRDSEATPLAWQGDNVHPCIQQCLHHVIWNEQFYWEASPEVSQAEMAVMHDKDRRPPGCLIRYRRNLDHEWPGFTLEAWQNATSGKRIVRVDPMGENASTAAEQEWASFCYSPCATDPDCGAADAFQCVNSVCKRQVEYWEKSCSMADQPSMTIISGASTSYFRGLKNLAGSVQYWAPGHSLVVYNLGMSPEQLSEIETWENVHAIKWRNGFPSHFPKHARDGKKYAWKSLAINESLHEYRSIFWMDAGSTLVNPLTEVERIVQETGMFLVHGQDVDMKPKSHPASYEYFGYNKSSFHGGPHFGGGTQAHMLPSRYVDTIVKPNAVCALDASCVAPAGSSLSNHRYDQSTLSILAYQPHIQAPHHTEYLAGSKSQLNANLHKPSGRFVLWTARQACNEYVGDLKVKDVDSQITNA
jgi:hypothetical protein